MVPREGFALDLIRSSGIKGKSLAGSDARGGARAGRPGRRVADRLGPPAATGVGVGGYSSGPVVFVGVAARRADDAGRAERGAGSDQSAARAVRARGRRDVRIDEGVFRGKAFVSGNPVRPEFVGASQPSTEAIANERASGVEVLVFGGSQGAHAINVAMVEAAAELAAGGSSLRLTHQTGERDVEMVRAAYRAAGLQADVEPFFYDMGRRVGQADLIVCRAGATTIAEITAAGKPAILIPLPTATDDHQRKNADALASAGAAEVLLQADATGHRTGVPHPRAGEGRRETRAAGKSGAIARKTRRRASDCERALGIIRG